MRFKAGNYVAVMALLGGTLVVAQLAESRGEDQLRKPLAELPAEIGTWKAEQDLALEPSVLRSLKASSTLSRIYRDPKSQGPVSLFIAYYSQQRAGESMHSPKNCLPGAGWEIWDYQSVDLAVGGRTERLNRYSIQKDNTDRMKVLYWYQSSRRIFADEYMGKLYLLRDALVDGVASGALVRVLVADQPEAVEEANRFAATMIPEIQKCLGARGSVTEPRP